MKRHYIFVFFLIVPLLVMGFTLDNAIVPKDEIGGNPVQIVLSEDGQVMKVQDHQARTIPAILAYWFAWQAFHPDTEVYEGAK